MDQQRERDIARRSAWRYVLISLASAALFLLAATLVGDYPPVARIGGTVWVWILSSIVSMPVVTARVKRSMA